MNRFPLYFRATLHLFAIAISFFCISACTENAELSRPPITLPFEVQKAGAEVESDVQVVEHREYIFSLVFRFDEKNPVDRSRVKKLVGDDGQNKDGDPGISTPLRLKITLIGSGSEEPVFDQEIQSLRLRSWGGNFFSKHIAYVRLKPGHYRIRVQSLKDVPELGGTKTDFAVGYYAKSTPIR
jgi:hypothetical protein